MPMRRALSLLVAVVGAAATPMWMHARTIEPLLESSGVEIGRDGLVRMAGAPFNGSVRERWPDGSVKRIAPYRAGQLDGMDRAWYPTGARWYERRYAGGRERGVHSGWYASGARRFVFTYDGGRMEGVAREWYDNGLPFTEFHYVHGQEQGTQRMWTETGAFRANYVVRDGRRYGSFGATGCRGHGDSTVVSAEPRR